MNAIKTIILGSLIYGGIMWYSMGVKAPVVLQESSEAQNALYDIDDNNPAKRMSESRQNESNKIDANISSAERIVRQFGEVNEGHVGFFVDYYVEDNKENRELYLVRPYNASKRSPNIEEVYYAVGDSETNLARLKAEKALEKFLSDKEVFDSEYESFKETRLKTQEEHSKAVEVAKERLAKAESNVQINGYLVIIATLGLWTFCPPFRFLVYLIAGVCTMGYFQNR